MVEFITKGTISFVNFSSFGNDVVAVVSSRDGGYSKGEYASLNMSFFLGDNPLTVAKNRQKFFNSCDLPIERAVGAKQNHGTHIAVVDKTMAGQGALCGERAIKNTDGLLTDVPGLPLLLLFADCTPLLFFEPHKKVVGVAHGGWRGSSGNIAGKMINLMKKQYGCLAKNIRVGIGPTIGAHSFEVGKEVVEAFYPLLEKHEIACNLSLIHI